jgi:serine kinase of HPr protein (carbohydrate metabolism regulator)|tara:strand:- start:24236 stop:24649 length:414 start_codon:yes stop_codon:yes gene_type:complete
VILHAGLIARPGPGGWRGALIEGPSGAGKSDLALRCLDHGFRLVADDRVITWVSGGRLFGRAPDSLVGQMEIRGVGVRPVASIAQAPVALWIRLGTPERLPDLETVTHLGVEIPLLVLAGLENSAPVKLSHALDSLG